MGERDTCWLCGGRLIWQSDFAYDECNGQCEGCEKEYCDGITSYLLCSQCGTTVTYNCTCEERKDNIKILRRKRIFDYVKEFFQNIILQSRL